MPIVAAFRTLGGRGKRIRSARSSPATEPVGGSAGTEPEIPETLSLNKREKEKKEKTKLKGVWGLGEKGSR